MIPDINQIIEGLLSGQYSREQAMEWIEQHLELACESGGLRDHFAGLAMQGLLAGSMADGSPMVEGDDGRLSKAAFVIADAMLKARKG